MEEIEGSLHVVRLDDAWDPESSTYNITFAPNASGDSFTVGKVAGDAKLEAMLRRCIPPEALEDRMEQARAKRSRACVSTRRSAGPSVCRRLTAATSSRTGARHSG